MKYQELKQLYIDNFSLGYINTNLEDKLKLIGLLCNLYNKVSQTKPDITMYSLIQSINKKSYITDDFALRLSILCEDLAYECKEFPNYGLSGKEMIQAIKDILVKYLPF